MATKKEKTSLETQAAKLSAKEDGKRGNPIKSMGGYFAGAWHELKEVRWPNRKATWSLTFAVLGFTIFFAIFVLLLDALFKYLFGIILG